MANKEIKELHALIDGIDYPAGVEAARRDSRGQIINEAYLAGVYNQTTNKIDNNVFVTNVNNYKYLKILGAETDEDGRIPSFTLVKKLINTKISAGAEYLGTTDKYEGASTKWSIKQPDSNGDWGRYNGTSNDDLHKGDILVWNGTDYDILHTSSDANTYYGVQVNGNVALAANGLGYLNLINGKKINVTNTDGTVSINHDTYSAQNVSSFDYVKSLISDDYGHVTSATGGTAGVISSDNTIIITTDSSGNVSLGVNVAELPGQITASEPLVATQNSATKVYNISLNTGTGLALSQDKKLEVSLTSETTGTGWVIGSISASNNKISAIKAKPIGSINGYEPDADGKFVVNAGSNITFDDADGHLVINSSGGTIENADTQASGRTYIAEITSKTEGNITTSTYKSHAFFSNFKSTSDYSTASIDSSDVVFLTVKA